MWGSWLSSPAICGFVWRHACGEISWISLWPMNARGDACDVGSCFIRHGVQGGIALDRCCG
ncbi:hypothetical protein PF005_g19575 [Phytophthora fragariae]|uniref:Uncharacterized protein n=1 Tax=Phytophthora fragariae TaxID=53985 RepID=A0A6A3WRN1_9STRA|nr:hypothetical protein PF003_g3570 [Phytophthora fragariae]KAE8928992.1 hypothetical protein PF009_g20885 [Phytophthora fragariae]KAE8987902.1 hypothetical protein PF011_g19391 [Phytophthora fragariae]KAE9087018.1 hypothetical protein PF007_g20535 [Phytophthora fragariae]KAE9088313.1 hypothetical protein PF010_g19423 [Phytophthora fragariae]